MPLGRLVKSIGAKMQMPKDTTAIQLSIIKAEYKPILIQTGDEKEPFQNYYLPSPPVGELLKLRKTIENISERLNPPNQCNCAVTISNLKAKLYVLQHGEFFEDNTRGESLDTLKARVKALEYVYTQTKDDESLKDSEYANDSAQNFFDAKQLLVYKEEALKLAQKELEVFKDYTEPPASMKVVDVHICSHCESEIAHPLQTILFDEDLYDALCQALLGIPLEEAKDQVPLSQIKYLWVHAVNWLFNLPEDLPKSFLSQAQKALSMTNLGEPVKNVIGLAEKMEEKRQAEMVETEN
jgi:hypothetical protein